MSTHTASTGRAATSTWATTALAVLLLGASGEALAAPAPFVTYLERGQLFTRTPGEPARATGLRPDAPCGAAVGEGDAAPLLTPDGRTVAFVAKGNLAVASLDPPGAPVAVTHLEGGGLCVMLAAWSPDGRRLVYHVGVPSPEEPAPAGARLGFFLWDAERGESRPLPTLEGVTAWGPASDAVLQVRLVDRSTAAELRSAPLDGGATTLLARLEDSYGFGQLVHAAGRVAYTSKGAVWVAPAADVSRARALARGAFGELQAPQLSPDGRRILWFRTLRARGTRVTDLVLASVDGEPAAKRVAGVDDARRTGWLDATHFVVCDDHGLSLRSVSGEATSLAGPGVCFVRR